MGNKIETHLHRKRKSNYNSQRDCDEISKFPIIFRLFPQTKGPCHQQQAPKSQGRDTHNRTQAGLCFILCRGPCTQKCLWNMLYFMNLFHFVNAGPCAEWLTTFSFILFYFSLLFFRVAFFFSRLFSPNQQCRGKLKIEPFQVALDKNGNGKKTTSQRKTIARTTESWRNGVRQHTKFSAKSVYLKRN